jgi:protein phosphatase
MSVWVLVVVTLAFLMAMYVAYSWGRSETKPVAAPPPRPLPRIEYEEDEDVDPTKVGRTAQRAPVRADVQTIVYDEDAVVDEPTQSVPLILLSATAQTDKGQRRKSNEDSLLVDSAHSLFVVADGMGGYRGGELASRMAVETIARAFTEDHFDGPAHDNLPRRASELARSIQMANVAILARAEADRALEGMGTTLCAARFSRNKQRMYIGHVGDSRIYRLRGKKLKQMTADHTMKQHGVEGVEQDHLSRAVGVWPVVPIDIMLAKPIVDDVYLLCSDGLSKMLTNDAIAEVLRAELQPAAAVDRLVQRANEGGGLDNITAILVRVTSPERISAEVV